MTNEVAMTRSFQEKMFERIRESIGDLMSDEDLKNLLDATMHKAFFEGRKDQYGRTGDPEIVLIVRDLMQEQVKEAARKWMSENPEAFAEAVDAAIAKGLFELVRQHFEGTINQTLLEFGNRLRNAGFNV